MNKLHSILALVFLSFLTWHSARSGYAARLIPKVLSVNDLSVVAKAVRLTPNDPHAQVVLGALLEANDDRAAALEHYQTAVALRPDDYVLRMQLARAQELAGDSEAASKSGSIAVTLAPFYAQPRWQLGNILVRAGRLEEGFAELRRAAGSDPKFLPAIIDLAWQISSGDVDFVMRHVAPQTPSAYLALGDYLKRRNRVEAAIAMFGAAGDSAEVVRARKQYVNELINAKEFKAAYQLWVINPGVTPSVGNEVLIDPGFEMENDLNESFGWHTSDATKTVKLSLDDSKPQQGSTSLRVEFNGATSAAGEVISQLVLVSPKTSYRLYFAVRSEGLVSGGLPNVIVVDASDNKLFGQTGAFPQTTENWQANTIDFTTGASTTAIQISIRRQPCPTPQCPIFGKLWLDDFILMGPGYIGEG
ncbi:MAG TPA: hypothetical protein VGO56_08220 [Pyrinomonadaceae bacterium]|nr:hypothetical protein [Pyrinomonadaceae bacterium]